MTIDKLGSDRSQPALFDISAQDIEIKKKKKILLDLFLR